MIRKLFPSEIEFRVQTISPKGWAILLAYKTARTDMNILDEVYGAMNWRKEYKEIEGKLFCTISVWDKEKSQWISKEDVGAESMASKEKGEASDAFKRAGFNWGIGRELYEFPRIMVKLKEDEFVLKGEKAFPTFNLDPSNWNWSIIYNGDQLKSILATDKSNTERFKWAR
jgi:hypothetical protein